MGLESIFEPILLDESEAQLIRPRMRDARERLLRRASPYDFNSSSTMIVCAICKQRGSFAELWLHLKQEWVIFSLSDHLNVQYSIPVSHCSHGKMKPTSEDIVPTIYSDQIPPIYLHWPPRDNLEDNNFEAEDENFEDENFEDENFEEFEGNEHFEGEENFEGDENFEENHQAALSIL